MQAMVLSKPELRRERRKKRIPEIDFLRGVAILLMVFDHLCVDLAMLPGILRSVASNYPLIGVGPVKGMAEFGDFCFYQGLPVGGFPLRDAAHILFVGVFCLLSGICCTFSRSNWRRTGLLFSFALLIKLAFFGLGQAIDDPTMYIYFGMLDSLFLAHLLYSIKDRFSKDKWLDLGLGVYFLILTLMLTSRSPALYSDPKEALSHLFRLLIGQGAAGGDYIRPLPVITLLFFGAFLGKTVYAERKSYLPGLRYAEPFCFCGRHSALIYLAHQPLLALILLFVCLGLGYRL